MQVRDEMRPPHADAVPLVRQVRPSIKVERLDLSLRRAEEPLQAARGRPVAVSLDQAAQSIEAAAVALRLAGRWTAPDLGRSNHPLPERGCGSAAIYGEFGALRSHRRDVHSNEKRVK